MPIEKANSPIHRHRVHNLSSPKGGKIEVYLQAYLCMGTLVHDIKKKPLFSTFLTLYFILCVFQLSCIPICIIDSPNSSFGCSVLAIGGAIITAINIVGFIVVVTQNVSIDSHRMPIRSTLRRV